MSLGQFKIKKTFPQTITHKITLTLVSMWNSAQRLVSVFQEFFASIKKILSLGGRLCTRLSFYEV